MSVVNEPAGEPAGVWAGMWAGMQTRRSRARERRALRSETVTALALRYATLCVLSAIFLAPFYLLFRNALLTQAQLFTRQWIWLPFPPTFQSIHDVFTEDAAPYAETLRNSFLIAIVQVVGQLLIASLAGYGLARIQVPGRNVVFYGILLTLMIPGAVTFVPTYLIVANLGWVNTLQGLIVPGLFNAFNALLFRQFFLDFPRDLEEAARIDGLSFWGIYWRIVVPNSRVIFISLGLLTFIGSWNGFLWPLVIGQDSSVWTVQIAISSFINQQLINYPAVFMGALISILPLLLIFLFAQRYIVAGIARSGIKE